MKTETLQEKFKTAFEGSLDDFKKTFNENKKDLKKKNEFDDNDEAYLLYLAALNADKNKDGWAIFDYLFHLLSKNDASGNLSYCGLLLADGFVKIVDTLKEKGYLKKEENKNRWSSSKQSESRSLFSISYMNNRPELIDWMIKEEGVNLEELLTQELGKLSIKHLSPKMCGYLFKKIDFNQKFGDPGVSFWELLKEHHNKINYNDILTRINSEKSNTHSSALFKPIPKKNLPIDQNNNSSITVIKNKNSKKRKRNDDENMIIQNQTPQKKKKDDEKDNNQSDFSIFALSKTPLCSISLSKVIIANAKEEIEACIDEGSWGKTLDKLVSDEKELSLFLDEVLQLSPSVDICNELLRCLAAKGCNAKLLSFKLFGSDNGKKIKN